VAGVARRVKVGKAKNLDLSLGLANPSPATSVENRTMCRCNARPYNAQNVRRTARNTPARKTKWRR